MSKTFFVSGHRDITEEEFIKYYESLLWEKINNDDNSSFVLGDCQGVDAMAQNFLKSMGVKNVKVYHMFESPRHNVGFDLVGGFNSDVERDFSMTKDSDDDIAWIRPGKERSGTAQNLRRRQWMNERITKGISITLEELNRMEANNFL